MKPVTTHHAFGQSQRTALLAARRFGGSHRGGLWKSQNHPPASGDHGVHQSCASHVSVDAPALARATQRITQAMAAYFRI
jgi:hypothetical protein